MKKCDGCGTEFDDSVELFPRLIITKEAQVARKLAEKEDEEMLCLSCWLDATDNLDKRQLAMLLLGMLRKINTLQEELSKHWTFPRRDVVETRHPWEIPNTNPIWVHPPNDGVWVGDAPPSYGTICKTVSYQDSQTKGKSTVFLSGSWSDKVQ